MKTIYLTGFMGAGKTTVGRKLSHQLNIPVYDTDEYIETKTGKKINFIFEDIGEIHFRNLENITLQQLPVENAIVTTGGGIVTKEENVTWMNENGLVFFLYADVEEVMARLKGDNSRPLLQNKSQQEVEMLFNSRMDSYKKAHYTIDTTNKEIEEIVKEIVNTIKTVEVG